MQLPISLLYLTDFLPIQNEAQMKLINRFLTDFELDFGIDVQMVSISEEWTKRPPNYEAGETSVEKFLSGVLTSSPLSSLEAHCH